MAVISISRSVGSGGHEIAQIVARQLGYRLFDQELMSKLGFEAGLTAQGEVVDLTAEQHHTQGVLERAFTFAPVDTIAVGAYEASGLDAEDRSANTVSKIILIAYEQGNVVVEGRGGQGTLRDKPGVLQVRVVAPPEKRVEYLKKRDGITDGVARKKIKEADAAQRDYIMRYYGAEIDNPLLYDFMINTGKVTLEAAAAAICDATARLLTPAAR